MIEASCHCAAVRIEIDRAPERVTSCNCSICRRLGAMWAYYTRAEVQVEGVTATYRWGDRTIDFHHCPTCGCATHYTSLDESFDRTAVNARMMAPEVLGAARVRRFDGADTWTVLDEG